MDDKQKTIDAFKSDVVDLAHQNSDLGEEVLEKSKQLDHCYSSLKSKDATIKRLELKIKDQELLLHRLEDKLLSRDEEISHLKGQIPGIKVD